jgi:hypothetical protein
MEYDDSDEYGFWQPEPTRRWRLPRASGSGAPGDRAIQPAPRNDEPTRQLRVTPGRRTGAAGSTIASAAVPLHQVGDDSLDRSEPTRQLRVTPGRRTGAAGSTIGSAAVPLRAGIAMTPETPGADKAEYYQQLSDLLDQDVAAAMGESVPLVSVAARRSWWSRARREDGRLDPLVTRVGVLLLVGAVALPMVTMMSAGAARTDGAAVVAQRAVAAGAASTAAGSADSAASADPSASADPGASAGAGAPIVADSADAAAEPVTVDAPTAAAQATTARRSTAPAAHRAVATPTTETVVAESTSGSAHVAAPAVSATVAADRHRVAALVQRVVLGGRG